MELNFICFFIQTSVEKPPFFNIIGKVSFVLSQEFSKANKNDGHSLSQDKLSSIGWSAPAGEGSDVGPWP